MFISETNSIRGWLIELGGGYKPCLQAHLLCLLHKMGQCSGYDLLAITLGVWSPTPPQHAQTVIVLTMITL